MSVWVSGRPVGDGDQGDPNGEVLACLDFAHYPRPKSDPRASVDVSYLPGPNQNDDEPVAPYVRLGVTTYTKTGVVDRDENVVLTAPAVAKLRDQLNDWLDRERHPR